MDERVRHRRIKVGQVDTFYREAGPAHTPVILLPHGYPCSSFEFRNMMPDLPTSGGLSRLTTRGSATVARRRVLTTASMAMLGGLMSLFSC